MEKLKKEIIKAIRYYKIIQLLLLGLILFISDKYIFLLLCTFFKINSDSIFYTIYRFLTPIALAMLWFLAALTILRNKRYAAITGRSYWEDYRKYKRSYKDLIEYFKDADPHKLDTSDFPETDWRHGHGFIFGMDGKRLISIPENCESNIAIFGAPGSGKTAGLNIINALRFQGSVLAIDIKMDIYNYCKDYRKIVRFCPDSPTALQDSAHFNPLSGINDMTLADKKLYIESLSITLIPEEPGSDGSYFTTRARKFFQGITHLLLFRNPSTSFPDIVHNILKGNPFDWVTDAMESSCIEAAELLSSFYQNSEKNLSGVYDTLCNALVTFSNPVLDKLLTDNGHCISIDTLEQGYDVYLQISQEHLTAYAPLFTMIIQSFSAAFTKRPDTSTPAGANNIPILIEMDEFPMLSFSYNMINTNLSTLRSKSIVACLSMQNRSQMDYKYQPAGARALLGNCNYQVILSSNDTYSSKIFSEMFGTKKVLKRSNSETISINNSTGYSIQEAREPVLYPEDFGDLPSKNQMAIYFKGKYCICRKLNCYRD